jgi:hypothetical protein
MNENQDGGSYSEMRFLSVTLVTVVTPLRRLSEERGKEEEKDAAGSCYLSSKLASL